jgi:hypothetical protein
MNLLASLQHGDGWSTMHLVRAAANFLAILKLPVLSFLFAVSFSELFVVDLSALFVVSHDCAWMSAEISMPR